MSREPKREPTPIRPQLVDITVDIATLDTTPPPPLLIERLDPLGHTILYGTGGVGKGALASAWVAALVLAGRRVLILDYERHPEEWARRIMSLAPDVVESGAIRYASPAASILGGADVVRQACDDHRIDYVVVDSAVMACGTDPLKPETAVAYSGALLKVARPALTLAHVTKMDDARYPFGSIFWHNLARMTWSMSGDEKETLLRNRKRSNYRNQGTFSLEMRWSEEGQLTGIVERGYSMRVLDRALEILADGPLSLSEMLERMNDGDGKPVEKETLRRMLSKSIQAVLPRVRLDNGIYSRV
jgi:hypothetical protein